MLKRIIYGILVVTAVCVGLRASALQYDFTASLSGAAESPPVVSPGTGTASVTYDSSAHTLRVQVTFSDLVEAVTASHIHGPTAAPLTGTAGVITTTPTFPGFPLGVTSGVYDHTLDLTAAGSYNPSFVTAQGGIPQAETALFNAMMGNEAYLNIHTTFKPGGEIRGFLTQVPDTGATLGLLCLGVLASAAVRRLAICSAI